MGGKGSEWCEVLKNVLVVKELQKDPGTVYVNLTAAPIFTSCYLDYVKIYIKTPGKKKKIIQEIGLLLNTNLPGKNETPTFSKP